jgi:hypothetical protein
VTDAQREQRVQLRRLLSWTLVVTLCIAALTAIGAILSGDFSDTDARVIATSIGFAVLSATAASGATLRFRQRGSLQTLGLVTIALSGITFVLLVVALWGDDGDDRRWQWFGCFGLATLAASHASLVSAARRATDGEAIRLLATVSIALAVIDSSLGILAIGEVVDEVDDQFGQLVAVLVVLLLLTSVLQPILRRLAPPAARPGVAAAARSDTLAAEVLAAADRIQELNADPARRAAEIRRECERLRELARAHGD